MIVKLNWWLERRSGNLLITIHISLGSKVNRSNHVWNLFMLLYDREQFLIVSLYLHVTQTIWNLSDLFNTASCYKCFGCWFIALSTYVEACFVEKSIDSLPIFNLEFWLVTFDLWSYSKNREIFWEWLALLMSSWLYFDVFCFIFWLGMFL